MAYVQHCVEMESFSDFSNVMTATMSKEMAVLHFAKSKLRMSVIPQGQVSQYALTKLNSLKSTSFNPIGTIAKMQVISFSQFSRPYLT